MGNKESTTASGAVGGQKIKHTSSSPKGTHYTASAASASSAAGQTHDASSSARRRIIQNFLLIWLDANIDESNDDFRHSMAQLRRSVNTIDTFTDPDRCVDYLTGVKDEKALMIVSGGLGQHTMPLIHDLSQLNAIFVFCGDKARHEQWAKQWPKIMGVFTEIGPICDALKQAARECDQDTIPISFVSAGEASSSSGNLDQLDQSFMYTQILKEILFEMDYDQQSIKDLAIYCRRQYAENDSELTNIAKFEREYGRDKSPIWWYTYDCFLYSMLNRALFTQEVDTIIKMGFFIRDLHRHITELHAEQYGDQQVRPPFIVYRGQGLSIPDFEKLTKTKGGLMSFNNFLSTSKKREVSLNNFAIPASTKPGLVGILFKMTIDPSISNARFAGIRDVSYFQLEEEILFSMHTIFRIGDIQKLDNRLWKVELRLTGDNDPLLSALTKRMREETEGSSGWDRLGKLLYKVGAFDKAEQVYRVLLDQKTSGDRDKAVYYHQLGLMKDAQGHYAEAISFYEKSLEIYQKTLPPNHPSLATSYNNIGLVYDNMGEYSKALSYYEKDLEISQKSLPPNHPDLATSYNNIGLVYSNMGEYSKALSFYEKSHEILQKTLPPNHPHLATSYSNIGLVYDNMGEYSKALSFYEKALEIRQKTLPPNHPDLASSYNSIGLVYDNMGEYTKALSFYEKALEIRQKALPPNHPDLATSYACIGLVYDNMGEYSKALSFYEKALEIRQKTLPPNHPDLASSYNSIGLVYDNMGEYTKALSFYEKALEIRQKALPPNHPDLASSYACIGSVYSSMGEYSKALSALTKCLNIQQISLDSNNPAFASTYSWLGKIHRSMKDYAKSLRCFEQMLEIVKKTLPQKHPYLAITYSNIGDVRRLTGDYSTALSFLRKALEIQESVSCDRASLAWTYTYMGETYREMKDYSTALEFHGKALEIRENVLPSIHPDLAVTHHNLAKVYRETNQFKLAHEHAQRAVEMAQQKLPESHPHLLEYRETVVKVRKKL